MIKADEGVSARDPGFWVKGYIGFRRFRPEQRVEPKPGIQGCEILAVHSTSPAHTATGKIIVIFDSAPLLTLREITGCPYGAVHLTKEPISVAFYLGNKEASGLGWCTMVHLDFVGLGFSIFAVI